MFFVFLIICRKSKRTLVDKLLVSYPLKTSLCYVRIPLLAYWCKLLEEGISQLVFVRYLCCSSYFSQICIKIGSAINLILLLRSLMTICFLFSYVDTFSLPVAILCYSWIKRMQYKVFIFEMFSTTKCHFNSRIISVQWSWMVIRNWRLFAMDPPVLTSTIISVDQKI